MSVRTPLERSLSIGAVAERSGVPAKTIRYYEEVGLIRPAVRAGNGYRIYGEADVHILRFLRRPARTASACATAASSWLLRRKSHLAFRSCAVTAANLLQSASGRRRITGRWHEVAANHRWGLDRWPA